MPRVRISPAAQTTTATRRRPSQKRGQISSEALQEAFVRVLLERGYEGVTIREVAAVAGVGIGTFYEYVANKQALAALTIHMRVKALAHGMQAVITAHCGEPLTAMVDAVLDQQVRTVSGDAQAWTALFMLERLVSTPEAYRKHYARFVALWETALATAGNAPAAQRLPALARMAHATTYGWVSQSLLTQGPGVDAVALRAQLGLTVHAYLSTGQL